MTLAQIQRSEQASWTDCDRVAAAIGDTPPPGPILHAAGALDGGRWQAASVWESKAVLEAFRDERVLARRHEGARRGGRCGRASPDRVVRGQARAPRSGTSLSRRTKSVMLVLASKRQALRSSCSALMDSICPPIRRHRDGGACASDGKGR
jgi:hypothetical protein